MSIKYEEINKEIELIPEDKKPLLLELIRRFRESIHIKESKEKRNVMLEIDKFAIETGIEDLAENHDYYLYGVK